ncbi:NAD(P)-binding protein [Pseudovirgaria hyperparasitica]|uniref:NAD(P)-binding protein n=1 Tax=Pseudovirgaria hyperparasitica TaxID=470096 RepID=A0A6A6W520_9PEZI|nr:NAD(P)-binding protein [Pseudovirgaria hyperparasitica]KAF2758028.1 NAD(P)-binding protein [Pseudovirgaria hyperparasitica]
MSQSPYKLIVVLGVTGRQGSSVASTFLNINGWKVRGVTRNVNSDAAKTQASKGVEIVQGDLDDVASLRAAFMGAHAIFLMTDFWSIFSQPDTIQAAQTAGQFLPSYVHDQESRQGINAAEAASSPEVLATLERFVFTTLANVSKRSGGKYRSVYHFDSKAAVEEYVLDKRPGLAKLMSTVNMGFFAENWRITALFSPHKQRDGSYVFRDPLVPGPHQAMPFVVAEKDTGTFVKALVVDLPPRTNLLGVSEMITMTDFATLWGQVLGVDAREEKMSEDVFLEQFPDVLRQEFSDNFRFVREFGYTGNDPGISTPQELGIPTTSMEQFIKDEDWSSVLVPAAS